MLSSYSLSSSIPYAPLPQAPHSTSLNMQFLTEVEGSHLPHDKEAIPKIESLHSGEKRQNQKSCLERTFNIVGCKITFRNSLQTCPREYLLSWSPIYPSHPKRPLSSSPASLAQVPTGLSSDSCTALCSAKMQPLNCHLEVTPMFC